MLIRAVHVNDLAPDPPSRLPVQRKPEDDACLECPYEHDCQYEEDFDGTADCPYWRARRERLQKERKR